MGGTRSREGWKDDAWEENNRSGLMRGREEVPSRSLLPAVDIHQLVMMLMMSQNCLQDACNTNTLQVSFISFLMSAQATSGTVCVRDNCSLRAHWVGKGDTTHKTPGHSQVEEVEAALGSYSQEMEISAA